MDPLVKEYMQKLQDAQDKASTNQLIAGIGSAGAQIGAGMAQSKYDSKPFDALSKQANAPVDALQAAQKGQAAEQTLVDQQEASDPNSEKSKTFRNALKATAPEIAKLYGDSFDHITAADKDNVFGLVQMRERNEAQKQRLSDAKEAKATKDSETHYKNTSDFLIKQRGEGNVSKDYAMVGRGENALAIANDVKSLDDLTGVQFAALATEVASMAKGGGSPTKDEVKEFINKTMGSRFRDSYGQISGSPQPAGLGPQAQILLDYTKQLKTGAESRIVDNNQRIIDTHAKYLKPEDKELLENTWSKGRFKKPDSPSSPVPAQVKQVRIQLPSGQIGSVPEDKLDAFIQQGAKKL